MNDTTDDERHRDDSDGAVWTPQRLKVQRWLERSAPTLAHLYAGAVIMASDRSFPGRVRFIGHAIREIRNRLPDQLAGAVMNTRTEYRKLAEEVHRCWDEGGLPADGTPPILETDDPTATGPRRYEISESLMIAIGALVQGHLTGQETNEMRIIRMFEAVGGGPVLPYVARTWLRGTNSAHRWAHESNRPLSASDESSLIADFEAFEEALIAIASRSYENMEQLDEILDGANR